MGAPARQRRQRVESQSNRSQVAPECTSGALAAIGSCGEDVDALVGVGPGEGCLVAAVESLAGRWRARRMAHRMPTSTSRARIRSASGWRVRLAAGEAVQACSSNGSRRETRRSRATTAQDRLKLAGDGVRVRSKFDRACNASRSIGSDSATRPHPRCAGERGWDGRVLDHESRLRARPPTCHPAWCRRAGRACHHRAVPRDAASDPEHDAAAPLDQRPPPPRCAGRSHLRSRSRLVRDRARSDRARRCRFRSRPHLRRGRAVLVRADLAGTALAAPMPVSASERWRASCSTSPIA